MIHLMIRHKIQPGKQKEVREACAISISLWQKYGCNVLGVWGNWVGGDNDELVCIYQFENFAEYEEIDAKVHKDPDWPKFTAKLRGNGRSRVTELWRPTEFSPLK